MTNHTIHEEKLRDILNRNVISKVSGVEKQLIDLQQNFQKSAQMILDDVTQFLTSIEGAALQDLREELNHYSQQLRDQVENELRPALRQEIEGQLRPQLESEIQQQLEPELRSRLAEEFKLQLDQELQNRLAEADRAARCSAEGTAGAKFQALDKAVREITQQQSQVNILISFLNQASCFAPRVAFLVVKGDNAIGWKAGGFTGDFSNEQIKNVVFTISRNELLRQILETQKPFTGTLLDHVGVSEVVNRFGPAAPGLICLQPVVVRNKVVALVYSDSGLLPDGKVDFECLEVLVSVVCLTVELSSTRTKLGIKPVEAEAPAPPPTPAVKPGPVSVEPPIAPAPVAPPEVMAPPAPPIPAPLVETPAEPKAVEPVPAPKPEPPVRIVPPALIEVALPPAPEPPVEKKPEEPPAPAAPPVATQFGPIFTPDMDENTRKLHKEACTFAKLLVTEIKLYNEPKVVEGRRGRNLYQMMRDDIDRSREIYDKRYPQAVCKVDYFYSAMVRFLANNEVDALGKEFSGPVLLH
jgi:hypothetical protein